MFKDFVFFYVWLAKWCKIHKFHIHSHLMISFLCTNVFIHIQQLLCHSTWTQFTFSDIFFTYEYIHSHSQHIFIHIQGHNFHFTLDLHILLISKIHTSSTSLHIERFNFFSRISSFTFAINIHPHSTTIFFIQHCCNINSTFCAHPFLRIIGFQISASGNTSFPCH